MAVSLSFILNYHMSPSRLLDGINMQYMTIFCCLFVAITTVIGKQDVVEFTLASYYQDHMVLQRAPFQATIWGYSSKIGDNVNVSLNGTMIASALVRMNVFNVFDGFWLVKLPPVSAAGPFNITVTSSEGTLELRDVLFGDVWICSGGSNMAMTLNKIYNSSAEIEDAVNYPYIRLFTVKDYPFEYPIYDVQIKQGWSIPNKDTVGTDENFSALCWLYGKYLYQTLGYPVGLVDTSYANSSIETWIAPEAAANCGIRDNIEVIKSGNTVAASSLWNGMVHPFANMTIYGAILSHGESDVSSPDSYVCALTGMIWYWRMQFYEASDSSIDNFFPVGIVQLGANRNSSNGNSGYPDVRWHQTADVGYTPNTLLEKVFLAVTMDLPDFISHKGGTSTRYKQDVARRLIISSRAIAYGQDVGQFKGPYPTSHSVDKINKIVQINYDYNSTPIEIRSQHGFELCCSKSERSYCNGTESHWVAVPITDYGDHHVTLSYNTSCTENYIMGVRYAWRESPCGFKKCAVYSRINALPAPTYISMGKWTMS